VIVVGAVQWLVEKLRARHARCVECRAVRFVLMIGENAAYTRNTYMFDE
jgi:hypothetical protein